MLRNLPPSLLERTPPGHGADCTDWPGPVLDHGAKRVLDQQRQRRVRLAEATVGDPAAALVLLWPTRCASRLIPDRASECIRCLMQLLNSLSGRLREH